MNSALKSPAVILGTWNFGNQVDEMLADRMVGLFLDKGYHQLDSAFSYCDGLTEEILGRILTPARRDKVSLATKVNPWSEAGLRPERVIEQVETSLKRMKFDYVDILYLHAPDLKTPIEMTLEACQHLFLQGKFRKFGLSNYASWQVVDIWHLCKKEGWVVPTVYQGMFNAITRDVERELFPAIRSCRIRFNAYNPLAGGLLTGKHLNGEKIPTEGRFTLYPVYLDRYWKKPYFEGLEVIRAACHSKRLSMSDSSIRWLQHHSLLKAEHNDGIIIAATNFEQLEANLNSSEREPLPADIVSAFDHAWERTRPACPQYFRT